MPGWEEGDWRDESLCQFKESNLLNAMGLESVSYTHLTLPTILLV